MLVAAECRVELQTTHAAAHTAFLSVTWLLTRVPDSADDVLRAAECVTHAHLPYAESCVELQTVHAHAAHMTFLSAVTWRRLLTRVPDARGGRVLCRATDGPCGSHGIPLDLGHMAPAVDARPR